MPVYLMRHGEAAAAAGGEPELTPRGVEQVASIAGWLAASAVRIDAIYHSPKLRASQTARIVDERVVARAGAHERAGLKPDDDPFAVAAFLESSTEPVLVVSHLPILDRVAGLLLVNDPGKILVGFAPAQVACFERDGETAWRMEWTRKA